MNDRKRNIFFVFIVLTASSLFFQCSHTLKNTKSVEKEKEVFFFDDFSANTLDRTKWNVRITGGVVNNEQQAYVDSSLTVSIVRGAASEGA